MVRTKNEVKKRKFEDSEVCNSPTPPKKKLIQDRQTDILEKAKSKKLKAMLSTVNAATLKRRMRRNRMRSRAGGSLKQEDCPPLYPTLSKTGRRKMRTLRKLAQENGLPFNEEAFIKAHECQVLQEDQQATKRKVTYEKCLGTAVNVKNGAKSKKTMKLEKAAAANDYNVGESPKEVGRRLKGKSKEKSSLMKCGNEDDDTSPKKVRRAIKEELTGTEGSAKPLSKVEKRKAAQKKARKAKWDAKQEIGTESEDTKLADRKQRFVLFAGNLPYGSTSHDLLAHFSGEGHKPVSVRIPNAEDRKKTRGFAYIEYKDVPGYQFGFTKDKSTLGGRTINVETSKSGKAKLKAKDKKPKQQGIPILV